MSAVQGITVAALAIVPGSDGTVVFVRQQRGPFAGSAPEWPPPPARPDC
ncbi:hypothetical protein [Dactylosporangium sp. CA-092794]